MRKHNSLEDKGMPTLYGENSINKYMKSTTNEIVLDYSNKRGRYNIEKGVKVGHRRIWLLKSKEHDTTLLNAKKGDHQLK